MNKSRYKIDRERKWGTPPPPGVRHGGKSWARKVYGCECVVCLPSGVPRSGRQPDGDHALTLPERRARLKEAKWGTPVPETARHGTVYAYRIYGCKCEVCRAGERQRVQRKQNAWQERSFGHWHDDEERGITVVHWPPAGLEETWQCPVCDFKKEVPA